MPLPPLLMLHICGAVVGLLSGYLAMMVRKGAGLHQVAGNIFFGAILCMSGSAVYMATFVKPNRINIVAGLLTLYLVSTAWRAAKRRDGGTGKFDVGALLFASVVAACGLTFGFQAVNSPNGELDRIPAVMYFIFGSVALLHALSDVRMLVRGGVSGAKRIRRHLWRMCLTLLIATISFFPGQARQLPQWLRESNLLFAPHIFLIASMIFWMIRVRARKRRQPDNIPVPIRDDEAVPRMVA